MIRPIFAIEEHLSDVNRILESTKELLNENPNNLMLELEYEQFTHVKNELLDELEYAKRSLND